MKTCDTAVMGHSVASGLDFWNRTCTCDTCDHNTAVWPIPVSHPTSWSHFSVPPSPFLLSRHGDLFASLLPSAHTSQSLPGSQTALTMVSCHCDLIFPLFCTTLLTAFCQLFPTSDIWCFVACCPTPLSALTPPSCQHLSMTCTYMHGDSWTARMVFSTWIVTQRVHEIWDMLCGRPCPRSCSEQLQGESKF